MTTRPLITATLICKNERQNLKRCLDSFWADVDEVVIVDTGSTDGTLAEAKKYALRSGQPRKLKTAKFTWCDDFSAARNAADELATGEWLLWCDLDDTVQGAGRLREYAENADESVVAFFCRYSYARDEDGNTISELWRERVVRNDGTPWQGRLHEHKIFTRGTVVRVDPDVAQWSHHRDHKERTGERNLRILESWDADQPNDARIVQSLAMEYMGMERWRNASETFERFLSLPGEPPDRRSQSTRHLCVMLMMQNRVSEAKEWALRSLGENWLWADTHLTLAEVEQTLGRPDVAFTHAQTALQIGQPDTLLIINPLQYTAHARALMAVCLAQMSRFEDAIEQAEQALQFAPSYPLVVENVPLWRGQLRKHHALGAVLALADVLLEAGEIEKATAVLGNVPWFIAEEPQLIRRRAEIVREGARRLREMAPPVPDEAADAFIQRHLEAA